MRLPETQAAVLESASASDAQSIDRLAEATGHGPQEVTRAAIELDDEGLLEVREDTTETVRRTEEGQ
jgi:phenylalanyl-tRNA synthetase alpha chain